jgi:hypothetical protein
MNKRITAKKLPAKVVKSSKEERLAKKATLEAKASEPKPEPSLPPEINPVTYHYPIGTMYMTANAIFTVIRVRKDSNTEWRTVVSANHGDQDYMLDTIQKDAKSDPNFRIVQAGQSDNAKS